MEENKIKVYIKIDENNVITDINSSIFRGSIEGYICIDEGIGDKYSHAQGNYLEKGLIDASGNYNYKLADNKPVELTEDEKISLFPTQAQQPTDQQILNAKLLQDNANLKIELEQQKKLNAQILLQIAGGSTND